MAPTLAISLFYSFYLGALGLYWPYLTLHLAKLGFSQTAATCILAISPVMATIAPPFVGLAADARRARVWLLRLSSCAVVPAFALFFVVPATRLYVALVFAVFAACRSPLNCLVDATALEHARRAGSSFGRLRLWGSVGFMIAALGGGILVERFGTQAILVSTCAGLGVAAFFAWLVPAPPLERRENVVREWLTMLHAPSLWIFLAAVFCAQVACASYDCGFTLYLHGLGYGGRFIGVAWAIGVLAEVIVLQYSGALIQRFGAERVLCFAIATAAVRWLALGHLTAEGPILLLQPLHGITFGCYYPAAVTLARQHAVGHTNTGAQGLFGAAANSGSVVGMMLAGRLLDLGGGPLLYGAASIVALGGTLLAWRLARSAIPAAALPRAVAR